MPFGHRGQTAQFTDYKLGETYRVRTPLGQLATQLRSKNPSLVVVRNTDKLKWPGASEEEVRELWKLIIDLARQSGVPHLLFGPISTVHEVLQDATMLNAVHLETLHPYNLAEPVEQSAFLGILNDYNSCLPWDDNDSLVQHADELDNAIAGDIAGLRQWLIRAVTRALGDEKTIEPLP